jgi:hypothetical protein
MYNSPLDSTVRGAYEKGKILVKGEHHHTWNDPNLVDDSICIYTGNTTPCRLVPRISSLDDDAPVMCLRFDYSLISRSVS